MNEKFFVASCVFTEEYPELSRKVQKYISEKNLPVIRCCVANYKVEEFENRMPENYRDEWRSIEHYRKFPSGSTMVSICHNCSAIFEERHPEINLQSIWELILEDENFNYPNYHGEKITVQDCWRQKENLAEQKAVREILRRMNFKILGKLNFAVIRCISHSRRAIPNLRLKDFCMESKVYFWNIRRKKKKI